MIAVGGDAVEVVDERDRPASPSRAAVASATPSTSRRGNWATPVAGLVGPELIELLAQHIGLEEPPIGREDAAARPLRPADRPPSPQQQPAFPPPETRASPPRHERTPVAARRRAPPRRAAARETCRTRSPPSATGATAFTYGRCMSVQTASTAARCRASRHVVSSRPSSPPSGLSPGRSPRRAPGPRAPCRTSGALPR